MDKIQAAIWEMIEAGGRTAQSFGLNRLLGQIYTLLYLYRDPLSLDEMAEHLGVSKASLSITCRQLEGWGALHRVWKKGDRRDYYTAERDFRVILNGGILNSVTKKLDSAKVQIERSLQLLTQSGDHSQEVEYARERLDEAERIRAKLAAIISNPFVRKML
jgi:DNA-binding transcriptional regulator GbsR (MarR family)